MNIEKGKVIAVIPARSGSKSIHDKNIMSIGGMPLIAHSILHAQKSESVTRVIVSTDSEYYAEVARSYGAEVPFLRPEEFAGDNSTDLEVFTHALQFLEKTESILPEICVHLRPTCPIREHDLIDNMVKAILANDQIDCIRSISEAPETPYKMWLMNENQKLSPVAECDIKEAYNMPRQVLPKAYIQNASVDVIRSETILKKSSMTGDYIKGYPMKTFYDIDTYDQFYSVERSISGKRIKYENKIFCFDIDGVIATLTPGNDYSKAGPIQSTIDIVNTLYDAGNTIYLYTARGSLTGLEWRSVTERQMAEWNVKYHALTMGKPGADFYIDDKMILLEDIRKNLDFEGKKNDELV